MAIEGKVISGVKFPEYIEVEVVDNERGTKQVERVPFEECFEEVRRLMASARTVSEAAELIEAMAEHRAVDNYMRSIGIDPHANR